MIDLRLGDCLDIMPTLAAQSFDAIIADIPYGTTACKWDTVIPFAPMWENLKRLAKPRAAIVLFGSQPFTSALVMSNPQMFRYEWAWDKKLPTGYLDANKKPLKRHENIIVFSSNGHTYNPQKWQSTPYYKGKRALTPIYGVYECTEGRNDTGERFPTSILELSNANRNKDGHPTQKPIALMEYLIRTYTNEGDTVLDFTMGSGTTLVACVNTNRNGVGIEQEQKYFEIAQRRIQEAQAQLTLQLG